MGSLFESDMIVVLVSALAAALSFAIFALPFLNREEKRDRYRNIIEKKRKELFEQSKEDMANRGKSKDDTMSAGESMIAIFKLQQMMGKMGEKVRDKMLQAGVRSPSAPIKFIFARFALPVFFMLWAMLLMSMSESEFSSLVTFLILIGAIIAGYGLPGVLLKNMALKRSEEISLSFPDALDMMLICVQGGIGLEQTVDRIAEEVSEHSETLAEELGLLSAEMAMLNDRRVALQDFARRVGSPAARSFSTSLIQAEQYGTSVSGAMRVMSDELRDERMATAEQKAAALPPKLTVPMILFFLPVLFVVILGPVVLKFMGS